MYFSFSDLTLSLAISPVNFVCIVIWWPTNSAKTAMKRERERGGGRYKRHGLSSILTIFSAKTEYIRYYY